MLKQRLLGATPRQTVWGEGLKICISVKFSSNANAAGGLSSVYLALDYIWPFIVFSIDL